MIIGNTQMKVHFVTFLHSLKIPQRTKFATRAKNAAVLMTPGEREMMLCFN